MGANLEVFIISNKIINIDEMVKSINKTFLSFQVVNAKIMDDWEYLNHVDFNYTKENLETCLYMKKIITIHGVINNKYMAGIYIYMRNNIYVSNLWVDITDIPSLDIDYINSTNESIYNNITKVVCDNAEKFDIIAAAIGVELLIHEDLDIDMMVQESLNVSRWILFDCCKKDLKGFSLNSHFSNALVYTKKYTMGG